MTAEWNRVIRALLGSWPGTMAAWGADAIEAYVEEVEARGLTPDDALRAIRTWPAGSDFPPSAPNLAAAARKDPSVPTFDELLSLVYGRGGIVKARPPYLGADSITDETRHAAMLDRARGMHPLVSAFVSAPRRLGWLLALEVDCPDDGHWRRRELEQAWGQHLEACEGRSVAALTSGRGAGELGRLDPFGAVGVRAGRRALETGERA